MLLKLRSVRLRDYIAGLEDSRGERLQTREFIAGAGVTVGKDEDSVWISGPKRTIVIPWSSVLQCELDTEWWDARGFAGGDTDAAQVQAYGAEMGRIAAELCKPAVLVGYPVAPSFALEPRPTPTVYEWEQFTPAAYPLPAVYPNEAEQRTQATDPHTDERDPDIESRLAPRDTIEALTDAIGAPMRRAGEAVNPSLDTAAQSVNAEVDTAPKPLSRKQRRKRR